MEEQSSLTEKASKAEVSFSFADWEKRGKSWEVWRQLIRVSECQPGHRSNEHSALRAIENFGNFETTRMRETSVVRIKLIGAGF